MKYDLVTRWLHAAIAFLVVLQLVSSEFMEIPNPRQAQSHLGFLFFRIHETSGLTAASFVALHWIWSLLGHVSGGWGHLFPWFSREERNRFFSDLRSVPRWVHTGLPGQQDETLPLAGAVHGLGLLVITGMAVTGSTVFFGMGPDGAMSGFIHLVEETHGVIAGFLYVYLAGHVGMAVIHQWLGHGTLRAMFKLFSK